MRYHYEKPDLYRAIYGEAYECNHPVYNRCTLYKIGTDGLAVIQQRYNSITKNTWWGEIDSWIIDELYLHEKFRGFFNERGGPPVNGLYPTVSIRQIMWALKMKPIQRERWETSFDRRII
ncbi:hypothetical protein DW790_06015 [Firmicutes bacterium AM31-12AC]|nr:hypothetical protein DW790_06015 [Firmicutes bacterium AM31-12AC]